METFDGGSRDFLREGLGNTEPVYHFISNSERNYMHAMSWLCRQLRHEVTKKAIKAALKLCACMQHVIYASHLRTCLWNGFKNGPEAHQHCLPHLKHPIQPLRSLVETLRPEVDKKR